MAFIAGVYQDGGAVDTIVCEVTERCVGLAQAIRGGGDVHRDLGRRREKLPRRPDWCAPSLSAACALRRDAPDSAGAVCHSGVYRRWRGCLHGPGRPERAGPRCRRGRKERMASSSSSGGDPSASATPATPSSKARSLAWADRVRSIGPGLSTTHALIAASRHNHHPYGPSALLPTMGCS